MSEVRSEPSGKPGDKGRRLGRLKNPSSVFADPPKWLGCREAPGLRSSRAKPQSWFYAHRVKALTATAGNNTRYGYTYVRIVGWQTSVSRIAIAFSVLSQGKRGGAT